MQLHGPKRVYNLTALEFWFNKLTNSWERFFPGTSIEMGRRFYREGLIREIELSERDAIIHSKIDGKECYAVIDWSNGQPSTRASIDQTEMGQALAIAGLYEIEEMVVEEISPLPVDAEKPRENEPRLEQRLAEVKKEGPPGRRLHLAFDVVEEGLVFEATWLAGDGSRSPALGQGNHGNMVASEREAIIRLASLSRKAHFHFCQETFRYILREAPMIQSFLKQEVQGWRKFFRITLAPAALKLAEGVKEVVVEARARPRADGNLNLEWIFRAGEKLLSAADAGAVLKNAGGAVLLPEVGLVELSREKTEAVRDWQQKVRGNQEQVIPRYLLFSLFNEGRIKIEADPELEAWRSRLLAPPEPLQTLPPFLRSYQQHGVQWMAQLFDLDCHGLLADEMGLGKTVQVIALMAARATAEKKHLVVVPASVIPVWQREFKRFYPELPVHLLKSGNTFADEDKDGDGVWLASYTQLRRHSDLLRKVSFGYAVLDEGQLIKNPDTKITRACFSIRARHRLVLTGTPLENRQLDLWSIFHFLMPDLLGSRASFEAAAAADPQGFLDRLRLQVSPFVLRRTKRRVAAELPEKIEMTLSAPLTARQRDEYGRICREGLDRLGDSLPETMRERSFGLFSLLTRLRQVCCDPGLLPWANDPWEESGKITMLLENLSAIVEGGHKVVIFSQFVALLNRVHQALDAHFPDLKRFALDGATADREKPVEEFQTFDGPAVILVSLRAGGTGITLHAADYLFLLDPWWNPAVEAQAIDRVHRIGQTSTVFVYRMVTAGTIEERIQELKEKKRELFDSVIGGIGGVKDIRDNFASLRHLIELGEEEKG